MRNCDRALSGMLAVTATLFMLSQASRAAGPETVQGTVQEQVRAETAAQQSQNRINQLDDETQKMLNEFRVTAQETDSLKRYNQQVEQQLQSQKEEMVSIQNQVVEIDRTNREIYPLMQRMLETLDRFVALDLPFLPEERGKRVAGLKEMMARADVSTAEKYRRLMEAYQVEMEYGRTIEAYEGRLGSGDDAKTVEFLRIGRVALLYQTLDGDETGYWDARNRKWEEDDDYEDAVKRGLRVAKKQSAPDLLIAPLPAPAKEKL